MELQTAFYITDIVWFVLSIVVTIGFTIAAIIKPIRRRRRRFNSEIEDLGNSLERMNELHFQLRQDLQEQGVLKPKDSV